MCMKYVNVNICCFDDINNNFLKLGRTSFTSMLESVKSREKDEKFIINDFSIVTFINIRGTKNGNNMDNPLDAKRKLDFKIRLTKLDENVENQLSYDIKEFTVDLLDCNNIQNACFPYKEHIEIINIDELALNDKGSYVIKALVKDSESELYDVQITHPLYIQ